jgi:hypothetical protein
MEESAVFKDAVSCYDNKGHCFTVGIVVVMQLRGKGDYSPSPPTGVEVETDWSSLHPIECLYGVHGHFTFL